MKILAALICVALAGCNNISVWQKGNSCNYFPNKDGDLKISVEDFSDDTSIHMIIVISPSSLNGMPLFAINARSIEGRKFEMALHSVESEDKRNVEASMILDKRIVQEGVCVSASYGDLSVTNKLETISQMISLPKR